MFSLQKKVEEMIEALIKPKRQIYSISDLGSTVILSETDKTIRHDLEIQGARGSLLISSLFIPQNSPNKSTCIVYLHSMGGSRLESIPAMKIVIEKGFSFFTFDFPACGHSEGDIITFGIHECEEVRMVTSYLRNSGVAKNIVLWGRSMGAVTGLLYSSKYNDVQALVADSAFSSMNTLVLELSNKYSVLPEFILKLARRIIRSSLKSRVGIDFDLLNISEEVKNCNCPCLLIASKDDLLVSYQHSKELFNNLKCSKRILYVKGGHNEMRPPIFFEKVISYIENMILHGTPKLSEIDEFELEAELVMKENKNKIKSEVHKSLGNFRASDYYENERKSSISNSQVEDQSFISLASFSFAGVDSNKVVTGKIVSKRYSQNPNSKLRTCNAENEWKDNNRKYDSIENDDDDSKDILRRRTMSFAQKPNSSFFVNRIARASKK